MFLAFIFLAAPCLAQITSLATVYDGSKLYLTTQAPLGTRPAPFQGRLFVRDANGLRLFREREVPFGVDPVRGFFSISYVDLSSDGEVLSYTESRRCPVPPLTRCGPLDLDRATIEPFPGHPDLAWPGFLRLSPNGRFVFVDVQGVAIGASNYVFDLSSL